jgi:hypothetical protein
MLKLLENKDSQLLKDFIDQILHNDPTITASTRTALDWYLTKLTKSPQGCNYFAELENNKISKVLFTMTMSSMLGHATIKVHPFWIIGFVYSLDRGSVPAITIQQLADAAIAHYEAIGYTTFFVVNTIPAHYTDNQINKYVQKAITKSVKYNYYIESVIVDPANYDDFLLFKIIIPKEIPSNTRVLITRGHLKQEFRTFTKLKDMI